MNTEQPKYELLKIIKNLSPGTCIRSCDLEYKFKISGPQIRDIIRELRIEGHPIEGTARGYHYGDINEVAGDLESRAYSMLDTASKMKKNYKPQQLKIF